MQKIPSIIGCAILIFFCLVFPYCEKEISPLPTSKVKAAVVLLHGLRQSSGSMEKMEKTLSSQGYNVVNVDYPSTDHTIEYLASVTLHDILKPFVKKSPSQIHFVTHSMGGIIVRYYLKHQKLKNLGRVVMISPPNRGSELVELLKDQSVLERIYGPAAAELNMEKGSLVQSLGPVDFELGVIAGNRSFNPLYSALLPGPDDGVVTVESMKIEGMKDFIILPQTHTFIMKNDDTIAQVIYFLEHGVFNREEQ